MNEELLQQSTPLARTKKTKLPKESAGTKARTTDGPQKIEQKRYQPKCREKTLRKHQRYSGWARRALIGKYKKERDL